MISRRLLRIKALLCLYAWNLRNDGNLEKAENELLSSINKSYELYHYLLLLIIELADIAREKIDLGLRKKIPTQEDLNPNLKFVNNKVIELLRKNKALKKYSANNGISWTGLNQDVLKLIFNLLTHWDTYKEYMSDGKSGFTEDKKFITRLVTEFFPACEDLLNLLEEENIYWNDDIEHITAMIAKTLRKFKADSSEDMPLMPLYKNEEDREFIVRLFRKAIINADRNIELIDKNTTNWEVERIALMDRLVMQLAITEITEFEEIPVKVTLNEYIEISKTYCTSKSSKFVNGILDKIVLEMREKGLFKKTGRGLLGEN